MLPYYHNSQLRTFNSVSHQHSQLITLEENVDTI